MNIVFRVDSSFDIGTGHIMRCLTLAEQLKKRHASVSFISRALPGNIISIIKEKGYLVFELSIESDFNNTSFYDYYKKNWLEDATETLEYIRNNINTIDLLVLDHYGLDYKWESVLYPDVNKLMVIDDLANREHKCDILLDQNFYLGFKDRYYSLVPEKCKLLLGPQYVLLREEFITLADSIKKRNGQINRILVFFGGTDPTNETEKALRALTNFGEKFQVDVIVGATNPNKNNIQAFCEKHNNYHYFTQVSNISEFMNQADLAIGAGGTTTWERCFFGLPSITIIVADNQKEATESVSSVGATVNLGMSSQVLESDVVEVINSLLQDPEKMRRLSVKSRDLVNAQFIKEYPLLNILFEGGK
jgi:UDP-2,4-diacetamido-2,4,6-trideoxy-beta-L-altropyranose hydrolase